MKQEHTGILLIVLSAACYGFMAIFVKFAYSGQVNLTTALSVRFILASFFIGLVVFAGGHSIRIPKKDVLSLLLLCLVGYGPAAVLFFASLQFIPASLASLILFTHPVMVTIFEVVVYKYPITVKKALALALSTTGLFLVMGNISGEVSIKGIALGLGAALSYTVYLLYGKKIVGNHPPAVVTAYILTFSAIGFTLYGLVTGGINIDFPISSWIWVFAMAIISTCMGIVLLFAGLKRLEAGKASIVSTLEVVITLTFSAILLREVMTLLQLAGAIMILAGIVFLRAGSATKKQVVKR
ncbi:MAG: DMT family transporter [Desulfocucumaceae bacterium]